MIILYLIALVFILIFLLVNNKEFFSNQCSYLAWGPTYDFCVSNCMSKSRIGLWDLSGNFCNEDICRELCINCNHERCEWLSMWDKDRLDKELNKKHENPYDNELLPKKSNIKGMLWENEFKIYWGKTSDVDKFMIHVYDLTNPNSKVKVLKIDNAQLVSEGNENSYEITDLKKNHNYSITLYSLNRYGIGPPSNTININI
jgi:hypothetical protein